MPTTQRTNSHTTRSHTQTIDSTLFGELLLLLIVHSFEGIDIASGAQARRYISGAPGHLIDPSDENNNSSLRSWGALHLCRL